MTQNKHLPLGITKQAIHVHNQAVSLKFLQFISIIQVFKVFKLNVLVNVSFLIGSVITNRTFKTFKLIALIFVMSTQTWLVYV